MQLEKGMTADALWNAAQLEMVYRGKMHGFMRMVCRICIYNVQSSTSSPFIATVLGKEDFAMDTKSY